MVLEKEKSVRSRDQENSFCDAFGVQRSTKESTAANEVSAGAEVQVIDMSVDEEEEEESCQETPE